MMLCSHNDTRTDLSCRDCGARPGSPPHVFRVGDRVRFVLPGDGVDFGATGTVRSVYTEGDYAVAIDGQVRLLVAYPEELEPEPPHVLHLSDAELETLRTVLRRVGGNPTTSARRHAASVLARLDTLRARGPVPENVHELECSNGGLYFQ